MSGEARRLLALLPGCLASRVSVEVAAAAFGTGAARAADLLDELSRAGLMERAEPEKGPWGGHDIEPVYVLDRQVDPRAKAEVSASDRDAALTRVARMFLREGVAADQALDPFRARLGPLYQASVKGRRTAAEAADWFAMWHRDLAAVQAAASAAGLDEEGWQLAEALITAEERSLTPPHPEVFDRGAAAAERLGAAAPWCRMVITRSAVRRDGEGVPVDGGPGGGVRAYADRLCAVAVDADVVTRGWCLRELGQACLRQGSHHAAMSYLSRARELLAVRDAGHEAAITRWSIAEAVSRSGHDAKAVPELHLAATTFSRCGDMGRAAASKVLAAHAFYRLRRGAEALVRLDGCIPVLQDTFFPREEALAHALYAVLHPHREHAGRHGEQARMIAFRLRLRPGDPLQEFLDPG